MSKLLVFVIALLTDSVLFVPVILLVVLVLPSGLPQTVELERVLMKDDEEENN